MHVIDWGIVSGVTGTLIAIGGLWVSGYKAKKDKDLGVADKEQVARRDTVADRDRLLDQVQEMLDKESAARVREVTRLEQRVQTLEASLSDEKEYTLTLREYAQELRHHIFTQKPPPPPPVPARWGATVQP